MEHKEGFFPGVRGVEIYYQYWLPDGEPRAVLLLSHGLAEHSGRYANLVGYLVPRGYAVYALDHPGHGRSAGRRVYVERFEDFTDVLSRYLGKVRGWQPDRPVFLVGHSMGALIGGIFLLRHQTELAGAVLSGVPFKIPDNVLPITVVLSRILSRLAPRVGVASLDARGVSRDPDVVRAYVGDPLVYTGRTTARLADELLKAILRLREAAAGITIPLLILQGGADVMVDPDGARALYEEIGSADKTIKVYQGLYHEIYNEPEHERVLRDVEAWLEARLKPSARARNLAD